MKQLIPGRLIGNYRLIRELGAGAVGAVYEVERQNFKVRYALKVFTFMGGAWGLTPWMENVDSRWL